MGEQKSAHQRTHSLLLLQRLLSLRQGASPFTLLLDTVEQSSKPLVKEYISRAKLSKSTITYISFETLVPPVHTTHFIPAHTLLLPLLHQKILSTIHPSSPTLLIIDTLHPILQSPQSQSISTFLTSLLLPNPTTSLLATLHFSIPHSTALNQTANPYLPSPLATLSYLATTIIRISSLHHVLAEKRATERAHAPPVFGLEAGEEGVVLGVGANGGGLVLRVEYRRKSGRGVGIDVVFEPAETRNGTGKVGLLGEHPLYVSKDDNGGGGDGAAGGRAEDGMESTFSLGLTDKQRRDREGVVLPYFDAQRGDGGGQGGRILYQMGEEDLGDWDEEEDEI